MQGLATLSRVVIVYASQCCHFAWIPKKKSFWHENDIKQNVTKFLCSGAYARRDRLLQIKVEGKKEKPRFLREPALYSADNRVSAGVQGRRAHFSPCQRLKHLERRRDRRLAGV